MQHPPNEFGIFAHLEIFLRSKSQNVPIQLNLKRISSLDHSSQFGVNVNHIRFVLLQLHLPRTLRRRCHHRHIPHPSIRHLQNAGANPPNRWRDNAKIQATPICFETNRDVGLELGEVV